MVKLFLISIFFIFIIFVIHRIIKYLMLFNTVRKHVKHTYAPKNDKISTT